MAEQHPGPRQFITPERLMAFCDGVCAIAITLLIIEIHVPELSCATLEHGGACHGESLWSALAHLWPQYVSFLISFMLVGITWLNHHSMLSYAKKTDMNFNILNLLLMLDVVIQPFGASLLGSYITTSEMSTAVVVYTGIWMVGGFLYNLVWWYLRTSDLIDPEIHPSVIQRITRMYYLGPIFSVIAFVLSFFWDGWAGLAVLTAINIYFLIPRISDRRHHLRAVKETKVETEVQS